MVRADSSSVSGAAAMGNEQSKRKRGAEASSSEDPTNTTSVKGRAPHTTEQKSADCSPILRKMEANGHGSGVQDSESTRAPLKSLKRPRDEREYDEFGRDRRRRSRSPPYDEPNRRIDHYSPRTAHSPISPPNTRYSFKRERGDYYKPQLDHRREPSGGASMSTSQRGREQRSSAHAQSSPPRRLSPSRRAYSGSTDASCHQADSSPPRYAFRESDTHNVQFTSWTWKAPVPLSRQQSNGAAHKPQISNNATVSKSPELSTTNKLKSDAFPGRVSFNGLEGVPTGPKKGVVAGSSAPIADRSLPSDVGQELKRRPHIFISARWLPAIKATVRHLHLFLKSSVPNESDIHLDSAGYYILFEDSDPGRERLKRCYTKKSGQTLFGEYTLNMECRNVESEYELPMTAPAARDSMKGNEEGQTSTAEAATNAQAFLDELDLSHQSVHIREREKIMDPRLQGRQMTANSNPKVESITDMAVPSQRHSSPLRVPSRDKDDSSSSISGFTTSDLSASKPRKCHVCREVPISEIDSLVQCSTCSRRYHRRCHTWFFVPSDLHDQLSWQCRRCIKKQVPPKSRLSNASLATDISPAPSVGQPEQPPTKRPRLNSQDPIPTSTDLVNDGAALAVADVDGSAEMIVNGHVIENNIQHDSRDLSAHVNPMTEKPVVNSDDVNFHTAGDLVEKSFTFSVRPSVEDNKMSKSGKLNLTRKKIPRSVDDIPNVALESRTTLAAQIESGQATVEISTHTQLDDDERATRTKKSHKWVGGGADKQIIQAGRKDLSSLDQPIGQDTSAIPTSALHRQSFNESAALEPEISESPEDMRHSNGYIEMQTETLKSSEEDTTHKAKATLTDSGKTSNGLGQRKQNSRPSGPAHRMRPSIATVDQCIKCQKTIAFNPSGATKLCTRCRRDASIESGKARASPYEGAALENKGLPAKPKVYDFTATKDHHFDDSSSRYEGLEPAPARVDAQIGGTPLPSQHSPERKARDACRNCKSQGKPCDHQVKASADVRRQVSHPLPPIQAVPRTLNGADHSKDDLDFWNVGHSPDSVVSGADEALQVDEVMADEDARYASNDPALSGLQTQRSSPLSPPPREDINEDSAKPHLGGRKRKSNTTVAKNEMDLGDSYERPPNTYMKLIGMALGAAPRHSLKSQEIVQWIAENIPNYKLGVGTKWENGISATLSMRQDRDNGVPGLWRKIDSDGAKRNAACRYQLMPGQAKTMLQWDPVLKQPVSPLKVKHDRQAYVTHETFNVERNEAENVVGEEEPRISQDIFDAEALDEFSSPVSARRKAREAKRQQCPRKPMVSDPMELDLANSDDVAMDVDSNVENHQVSNAIGETSSDDEPLAASKRRAFGARTTALSNSAAQTPDEDVDYVMEVDQPNVVGESPSLPPPSLKNVKATFICQRDEPMTAAERQNLAQLIKDDAQNMDFTAKSLFEEWPEYDPVNQFDREAKIEEIKRRPTRKQRFGKPSRDPWLDWKPARLSKVNDSRGSSMSAERFNRPARNAPVNAYPWENGEGTVQYCDTLEELFGLPNNPIAIIHEGQLAYREGTRNDDGTLPRAKHIYKTGYA